MPTTPPLRIVLVDDHEMVHHGLKAMLTPFRERVQVVGEADGAADGENCYGRLNESQGYGDPKFRIKYNNADLVYQKHDGYWMR